MRITWIGLVFFASAALAQSPGTVTVSTLEGETLDLGSLARRGPTMVTFWALWCSPCKQELRALQSLYENYEEQGFSLVAINQDSPKSVSKVRSYVASQRYTFPVILDPNGQLLQRFNGQAIPFSVMLDSTGAVLHTMVGYLPGDEAEIEEKLLSILGSE
ncbi:MAG: TlpA disulfide reductase family protein [Bacteroidota bacterium]